MSTIYRKELHMNGTHGEDLCMNMHNYYSNKMDEMYVTHPIRKVLSPVMPVCRFIRPALLVFMLSVATTPWANGQLVENSIPAPTNINQNRCPCIMPDNSVVYQVHAPNLDRSHRTNRTRFPLLFSSYR